jgi:predicted house-cleaning noncanonical NTP pyrophosphatase (MazG superfamily)
MNRETENYINSYKLLRSKELQARKKRGEIPVYREVDDKEYYFALRDEFSQRASNLLSAKSREDFINQAARLLDVLEAFMEMSVGKNRITFKEIENARYYIQTKEGKFARRIILDNVEKPQK